MPAILTLQQIIDALAGLSDDELQELRDEIDDQLEEENVDDPEDEDDFEDEEDDDEGLEL